VQKEKIRLVMSVPFHLANQLPLVLPVHRAYDLLIEPTELWGFAEPSIRSIERIPVVDLKRRENDPNIHRPQRNIPGLLLGRLLQLAQEHLAIIGVRIENLEIHCKAGLL